MSGIDKRIEELELRLKQAKALKNKQEAQKRAALAKIERAKETRRKILAGSLVLHLMAQEGEEGEKWKHALGRRLDEWLTRNDDRELFNMPPLPETKDKVEPSQAQAPLI
ncbi:mobilization protein [Iodobacter sp. CM08]|uniref:mobilization protein n=1 Tax=Iodobacter sp. CM08 TaxID=3085902 RepID=UPI002982B720|nr:mobilization protein [Iodobacter sp. CM08]MDW5419190.1 mobilization protein [Iodobacter sp. CM08]